MMNPPNHAGNKGTCHIFFKTRICMKYNEGECRNGDGCNFAHGLSDLREPPPNWQELIREKDRGGAGGNWSDDQRIISHRMKICRKFNNGEECPYGDRCNFLHEGPSRFRNDVGRARESSAISIGTTGPLMGHRNGSDQSDFDSHVNNVGSDAFHMRPEFWRTRICHRWEATGHCPFGERCHFAHGHSELKMSGGHIDAEVLGNVNCVPVKPLSVLANDASPTMTMAGAPRKEEREVKKGFSKWKGPKKINCIYADWIDDLTSPHNFPSQVKS